MNTLVNTLAHLNKNLAQGNKGCADLREKQAANKEIALVLPEELWNTQRKQRVRKEATSGTLSNVL